MDYATTFEPHAMRLAEQLVSGLSGDTKRALLTHLIGGGVLPVLGSGALTATQEEYCSAAWDALVKARPGYLPPAAEVVKADCRHERYTTINPIAHRAPVRVCADCSASVTPPAAPANAAAA